LSALDVLNAFITDTVFDLENVSRHETPPVPKKQPQRGVKRCDCQGGRICKTSAGPLSTQAHAAVDCRAIQTAFQIYLGFSTHVASERFQSHALESRFCDVEPCMRWTPSIVPRGDDHNIGGRHGTASTDTKIDRQRFSLL
jgi:hypothetical protein